MNRNDIKILLCLNRFLPNDLSKIIIKYKREGEYNDIINEYVENDFHNWLEYDVDIRSYLGNVLINYQKNISNRNLDYIQEKIHETYLDSISFYDFYNYYERNRDKLYINQYYVRNSSLHICYFSKWYQTTEKNGLAWKRIHDLIKIRNRMKICINLDREMFVLREASFKEKIILINKIGTIWHYDFFYHRDFKHSNYQSIW